MRKSHPQSRLESTLEPQSPTQEAQRQAISSCATHAVSKSEIAKLGATPSTQAMRNPAIIEAGYGCVSAP